MSLYGAMFSGVSALNSHSNAMGMISDNISNLNTIGYKHNQAHFSTLVTNSGSTSKYAPGGVRSAPFQLVDKQGLLQASTSNTDVAITGNGFMVVNEASVPGAGDRYLYTRAGQFSVDKDGYLQNTGGYYLMGWPTLATGAFDVDQNGVADPSNPDPTDLNSLSAIQLSGLTGAASATTTASLALNLPATAALNDTHNLTVRIFDSLGIAHNVALEFEKTATPSTWDLDVTGITRADTGAASTTGLAYPINVDQIVFSGSGTPSSFSPTALSVPAVNWVAGAAASSISFGLGTVGNTDGVTQFAGTFTLNSINQNGVPIGRFQSAEISESGLVSALFDNGSRAALARLPIATFANPNAMSAVSGNAWEETDAGGPHFLNQSGTASAGSISPSSLEASTVDLGEEFTNMIITQRAFSASTKIITTADEMLEELVRVKR